MTTAARWPLCPDDLASFDEPTPLHDALAAQRTAARVAADYEAEAASADPLRRAFVLGEARRLRGVTW